MTIKPSSGVKAALLTVLLAALGAAALLLAAACQGGPEPSPAATATPAASTPTPAGVGGPESAPAPSTPAIEAVPAEARPTPAPASPTEASPTDEAPVRAPDASVRGTVTYRERLALTPGATLVVELRDVSYADAAAPLIARQTIPNPGQVPIAFEVHYHRDDIDPRNTYSVSARITESDGRLAFTNDTAYEVITGGNPHRVDLLLVLVQPPPELLGDGDLDWRTWVEVPVPVAWANLIPNEPEPYLRVAYYQSTIEGCARPGSQGLEVEGRDIVVRVTLMQPPSTPWEVPCDEEVVELDTVEQIRTPLQPGETYRVIANGRETTTFTLPRPGLGPTFIEESPVESAELEVLESAPPGYRLRVVSGMPSGSCSQFNGYEVRRGRDNHIDVAITHHYVSDPFIACTADYPIVETVVPLGADFDAGEEYTVSVNSDVTRSFVARPFVDR